MDTTSSGAGSGNGNGAPGSRAGEVGDRPRLRPLEAWPVTRGGQPHLSLRDPSRLTDSVATLPPLSAAVVELFDGERSRDEICAEFQRRRRQPLARAALDGLIEQLDQALLLDTPRFRAHSAQVFAEFARAEARAPLHAGHSYPEEPDRLRAQLDGHFARPLGPGRPTPGAAPRPRAIVAPHVDFGRGGPAYAWAYAPLVASADRPPEVVVVLGTDHAWSDAPFTLTRKHYDTPLGRLATETALVDRLAAAVGEEAAFGDEHHHRGEHSIEFQAVWLRHVYGAKADAIKLLPVLCGPLHDHVERGGEEAAARATSTLLDELGRALAGRDVLFIAAADLAHVGPRYGDRQPLDGGDKASLEKRDRETLAPVLRGDGPGWFEEIRRERDRRRVCGLPPIYAMLRAARPGEGQLAVYAQCPAEQGSIVSIASIVFP